LLKVQRAVVQLYSGCENVQYIQNYIEMREGMGQPSQRLWTATKIVERWVGTK